MSEQSKYQAFYAAWKQLAAIKRGPGSPSLEWKAAMAHLNDCAAAIEAIDVPKPNEALAEFRNIQSVTERAR